MHTIPCDTQPQIFNKPVTMNKYTLRKITIICKQTRRDPSQNAVWLPLVVFKANAKKSLFICQRAQGECQQWEQRYDCNTRMLPLANLIWTPPSARHVCIKIFLLINTQTSPSHATHSIASDCVTSDLPAASKDSLRTPDVWLDAIHLRHSERYTNVHTGTHTCRQNTQKQTIPQCSECDPVTKTSPWVALNYSSCDACACQSKDTHCEDKRYGRGQSCAH